MKHIINFIIVNFLVILILFTVPLSFAVDKNLSLSYDPVAPNFSSGQKNVIYVQFESGRDTISAANLSFSASGGVEIVDILSPLNENNTPLSHTKLIDKKIGGKKASATILLVQNSADLPHLIKMPVVITNSSNSGNLALETESSEIINPSGSKYTIQPSNKVDVTFSEAGKNNNPVPSPTSLPQNSMVVNISTKLQGITTSSLVQKSINGVKIQLLQQNGKSIRASLPSYNTFSVDESDRWHGTIVINDMPAGNNYSLLIKGPKHLQKRICENTPQEQKTGEYTCNTFTLKLTSGQNDLDFSAISLMTGDLGIQDGVLNTYDLSLIQNSIKKTLPDALGNGDLNLDGNVDSKDYDLILQTLRDTSGLDQK